MTVRICSFHYVQFCKCKRMFKGTVPRDLWLSLCTIFCAQKKDSRESAMRFSTSNILKNLRKYSQLKVHHHCRWHRGKFTTGVIDTSGKLPLMSLTPAANLLPVSLTLVENLQRRAPKCFFKICKSTNSSAQCKCKSANFWDMRVCKFHICLPQMWQILWAAHLS